MGRVPDAVIAMAQHPDQLQLLRTKLDELEAQVRDQFNRPSAVSGLAPPSSPTASPQVDGLRGIWNRLFGGRT
jgi:hypothetical protein